MQYWQVLPTPWMQKSGSCTSMSETLDWFVLETGVSLQVSGGSEGTSCSSALLEDIAVTLGTTLGISRVSLANMTNFSVNITGAIIGGGVDDETIVVDVEKEEEEEVEEDENNNNEVVVESAADVDDVMLLVLLIIVSLSWTAGVVVETMNVLGIS